MTKLEALFLFPVSLNLSLAIAQSHTNNYQIILSTNHSITNAYVEKNLVTSIKYDLTKHYYWYRFDSIHQTQGAWAGKRLHGQYEQFSHDKKLRETGKFHFGLKHGDWIVWHTNGNIKIISHWKKGNQFGQEQHFNEAGELTHTIVFRNGKPKKTRIAKKFKPTSNVPKPKAEQKKTEPAKTAPPKKENTPKLPKKQRKKITPNDKKPSVPKQSPIPPNRG